MNGSANLEKYYRLADATDLAEGLLAYRRYHELMRSIAAQFDIPMDRVVAAFAALSPNNDYVGNLRSLVSVLRGFKSGTPVGNIVVSTYKHCRNRAHRYLTGEEKFVNATRGLKITNFYFNIMNPDDGRWVTVDGHVSAAWQDLNLNMKDAIIRSRKEYREIADAIKRLAFARYLLPNQYQATIWFARKRVLNIKYDPQIDIFTPRDDLWQVQRNIASLEPFPPLSPLV